MHLVVMNEEKRSHSVGENKSDKTMNKLHSTLIYVTLETSLWGKLFEMEIFT